MEKNKRILTFSEFQKKYGKGSPYSKKTNMEGVTLMKDAAAKLDEPFIKGSKGDLDSISSKPATKKLKTDYEKTPEMPSSYNKTTTETGPMKTKKIETVTVDKEETEDKKIKSKPKSTKKIKANSKKSEEDKREEAGDY